MVTRKSVRHPIFASLYPRMASAMDRGGMAEHRATLLAGLTGEVIEIGAGNGANFPHYPPTVTHVLAVEPEPRLPTPTPSSRPSCFARSQPTSRAPRDPPRAHAKPAGHFLEHVRATVREAITAGLSHGPWSVFPALLISKSRRSASGHRM
jgi:hypothetical protein